MLSHTGDQFAQVAIAILVYGRTHSAFLTARVLLFSTVLTGVPFSSARTALMPDVLPGDKFVLGSAVGNITYQASQILGFVAGAGVVAILDPHKTLRINAATFGISALIVLIGVRARPTPVREGTARLPRGRYRLTVSGSSSAATCC